MEFVRCEQCDVLINRNRRVCPGCGFVLKTDTGKTQKLVNALKEVVDDCRGYFSGSMRGFINVSNKSSSIAMSAEKPDATLVDFETALRNIERDKLPMRYGLLACLLGLLGVFTLAIIFVPIAILFAAAGIIDSLLRRNTGAFLINALAWIVIAWAFLVSPSLWLLLGLSIA